VPEYLNVKKNKHVGQTWVGKCNQSIPLAFQGLLISFFCSSELLTHWGQWLFCGRLYQLPISQPLTVHSSTGLWGSPWAAV